MPENFNGQRETQQLTIETLVTSFKVAIFLDGIETIDHKKRLYLSSIHCIKVCEVFIMKVENYLKI